MLYDRLPVDSRRAAVSLHEARGLTLSLVSVIMPVRDGGAFLAEAVGSIMGQSHAQFELIIVDDHSTDHAPYLLDVNDSRLRVVPSQGEGVAQAFNTGMAQARGEFIARMDADDIALPPRLEIQLQLLRDRPEVDIAGGCVEIFAADHLGEGNRLYQDWLNRLLEPEDIRRELFIECPLPNPTALFRRSVLEELGGYRDCTWAEDYDLFLRADALGMNMAKPEPVVLRWRDHPDRLTRTDVRNSPLEFQKAKARYLAAGRIPPENILVWGAGPGGRLMHDLLTAEGASVAGFVDVHPRRVGGEKRGLPVWPIERAADWRDGTIVVAVGSRGARPKIREFLSAHGRVEGEDYLFVA